ncbi:hypothetical protein AC477_04090 [miscellaneous Crenarchaeota group-1 archaeon SG8-32-1]|uniref:Terminase large subunit gp17-like C-terminal domain-containing protein n=1 Tax=miscellaneous Crenarchaeota group-1 archaeon SG8-32-1 TaxID=1685124 RepID=A0A0M0BT94_9ARCH|nr:MAG: hypothetical protein AC477_04090 [miscellaneous Crenarchaeota group-1 archaeon SG8-32-1]
MKTLDGCITQLKKYLASKSLKFFAKTYFKHYCKNSFAPFHLELFDYLTEITMQRGRQLAIAAPRGNAKSSIISLFYVLWCICFGHEKCIILFSSTRQQSERLLAHIKKEISSNEELKRDFPEVCEPPNPRWRNDEIITKNGINVVSSSFENEIRGYRYEEHRPGLIILDDVEAVESVRSQDQREKIYEWFQKVVLNLGSEQTNYIIAGTILHYDSLLAKLISEEDFPGWDKHLYKSVIRFSDRQDLWDRWEQIYRAKESYHGKGGPEAAKNFFEENKWDMLSGTKVLWPSRETYYDLMVMRAKKGTLSFESEKQNEPKDTSGLSVDMNKVVYWDDRYPTLEELQQFLGSRIVVLGTCDPSIGKSQKSDYSAIVTVFLDKSNNDIYVIDADVGRWKVNTLIERILLHHKNRRYIVFGYENNAAQEWLGEFIKKSSKLIPIEPITNLKPKEARIAKLIVYIELGKVKLSKRLGELVRELNHYPNASHDDALDALAMAIDLAESYPQYGIEKIKGIFDEIKNRGSSKKHKGIISYGGYSFDDPFGLLKV